MQMQAMFLNTENEKNKRLFLQICALRYQSSTNYNTFKVFLVFHNKLLQLIQQ